MRLALRERDFRVTSWTSLLISCLPKISALPPRFVLAAYREMPPWLKPQRLVERPPRLGWSQRNGSIKRAERTVPGETTLSTQSVRLGADSNACRATIQREN